VKTEAVNKCIINGRESKTAAPPSMSRIREKGGVSKWGGEKMFVCWVGGVKFLDQDNQ